MARSPAVRCAPAVIAVLAVLMAACSADPASTGSSPTGDSAGPSETAEPEPTDTVFDPDEPMLEGGVGVLSQATDSFVALDGGRYGVRVSDSLLYSVDVPDSSEVFDGVYLNPRSGALGRDAILWVEVAGKDTALTVDPCHDHTAEVVGPTVEDLARALSDQPFLTVTRPVGVTVGGMEGLFVKVTVPDDAELSACQNSVVFIFADIGKPGGAWAAGDRLGLVDRMWILDVDGARHVLLARAWQNAGQQARAMTRMVESITFTRR